MAKKRNIFLVCVLVAATAAGTYYTLSQNQKPAVGTSFLMDTVVEYKLYGKDAEQAKLAIEQTLSEFENKVSRYINGSEIDQLNQNAGIGPVAVSDDTLELLSLCLEYGKFSEGVFDITVAPLTQEWNVTAEHPKVPSEQVIDQLLELVNYRDLALDLQTETAYLEHKGQAVDVGGIAKGFACDLARKTALDYGITSGYISIGGNLMVIGEKPNHQPFKFGVRDPRGSANDYIGIVTLPDSTMATSGDYERYFEQDGIRYHHILDPETGWPARTDLMSVSVVTPDGAYADFMSTYLFIKGKAFALEHLDSLNCGLIVVDKDRNVYISESLKDSFAPSDSSGSYQFNGVKS
ncbi:FAD:protein FMN transferase [Marasmitruncus massiliensis]|uniref:FAD:protein FMN transferase n=1 Tax=Marasmitruncus massiliensis TaxID=1944642 RepID=UPI000C79E478|nr:FAD:protein FMN transferase [Marasmitruncus massiliensis]